MALAFSFFFTQHAIARVLSKVPFRYLMFYQINELPEDGLKSFA